MEGNKDVRSALDESYHLLQCVEKLPPELMDRIIMTALFSEPLGSHAALHTLESLSREALHPTFQDRITIVFKSKSLREQIKSRWQLSPEFDHVEDYQENLRYYQYYQEAKTYDLASWTVAHCYHRCFSFLLGHGSVQAYSFCKTGESFFCLAMGGGKTKSIEHLVSLMDPKQLLQPCSINRLNGGKVTILQASTQKKAWFEACWKRATLLSDINPCFFGPVEVSNISQFATVELAEDLLNRGVDLGRRFPDNPSHPWWAFEFPGWWGASAQENPAPILAWLWSRGHGPPEGYLEFVAKNNLISTASWILPNTKSYYDWKEAAYSAAANTDPWSVRMFELILQHWQPKWQEDNTFAQNIVIKIVDEICLGTSRQPQTDAEDRPKSDGAISQLEKDAVTKVQYLGRDWSGIEVIGLKVKAKHAKILGLMEALDNLVS